MQPTTTKLYIEREAVKMTVATNSVAAGEENQTETERAPSLLDQQLSMYIHLDSTKAREDRLQSHQRNLEILVQHIQRHPALLHQSNDLLIEKASTATAKRKSKWDDDSSDEDEKHVSTSKSSRKKEKADTTSNTLHDTRSLAVTQKALSQDVAQHIPLFHGCRSVHVYERLNKISEGTYGVVFRALERSTGEIVALKQVKLSEEQEGFPITALRETNILLSLRHPNVMEIKEMVVDEVGQNDFSVYMVMSYWSHDLSSVQSKLPPNGFSVSEVKCIIQQILRGLAHCHQHWFLHRDLKTSNILYDSGRVAIADFGMARKFDDPVGKYTQMVVTLYYRAPELLLGADTYSTAVDVWSVGCILGELLLGTVLFPGTGELDMLLRIFDLLGVPSAATWPSVSDLPNWKLLEETSHGKPIDSEATGLRDKFLIRSVSDTTNNTVRPYRVNEHGLDLLSKLLCYDPQSRISASDALDHPWFQNHPLPRDVDGMPKIATEA